MDILDIILGDPYFEDPRYDNEYDNIIDLYKEIKDLRDENYKLKENVRYLESSIQLPRDSKDNPVHIGDSIFLTWNRRIRRVTGIEFFENGHIYIYCNTGGGFRADYLAQQKSDDAFYVINQERE